MMKQLAVFLSLALLFGCNASQQSLKRNAEALFRHVPDTEDLEKCRDYLTEDFLESIDEMVSLPDLTPVLHEWEFWFVAADGSPMADCAFEVVDVARIDKVHAEATVVVRPPDADYDAEEHTLKMEKIDGKWLLADFDETKQASSRYIKIASERL